jgi:hypothetical protein
MEVNSMTTNKRSVPSRVKTAGVVGAVVGAGLAVAASRVMNDKKTREAIQDKAADMKAKILETAKKRAPKQMKKYIAAATN